MNNIKDFFKLFSNLDPKSLENHLRKTFMIDKSDLVDIRNLLSPLVHKRLPSKGEMSKMKFMLDEVIYSLSDNDNSLFARYLSFMYIYGVSLGEDGEFNTFPQEVVKRYILASPKSSIEGVRAFLNVCNATIAKNDWLDDTFRGFIKELNQLVN
jgi:hypothetical protein